MFPPGTDIEKEKTSYIRDVLDNQVPEVTFEKIIRQRKLQESALGTLYSFSIQVKSDSLKYRQFN